MGNYVLELLDETFKIMDILTASEKVLNICNSGDCELFMVDQGIHKHSQHILYLPLLSFL